MAPHLPPWPWWSLPFASPLITFTSVSDGTHMVTVGSLLLPLLSLYSCLRAIKWRLCPGLTQSWWVQNPDISWAIAHSISSIPILEQFIFSPPFKTGFHAVFENPPGINFLNANCRCFKNIMFQRSFEKPTLSGAQESQVFASACEAGSPA